MGHAIEMLSFPIKMNKKTIEKKCDEWGEYNRDREEGGCYGLPCIINWTNKVFDDYESAAEYLEQNSAGKYGEMAVQYKSYPPTKPTKTMTDLTRRIGEYEYRLSELDAPHYKGVKQATVKCKCCGSALATKYCGTTFRNNCPVCHTDLRPQSTLDKVESYKATLSDLRKKYRAEQKKQDNKNAAKATLHWLVCCEVHC